MIKMLKIELHRLFRSVPFYISIAVGLIIAISHTVFCAIPLEADNAFLNYTMSSKIVPNNVLGCLLGMPTGNNNWQTYAMYSIMPILVSVPYGATFYRDKKTGYVKNLYSRTLKKNYVFSKYIVTFFSGGIVYVLPFGVSLIGNLMVLPYITPVSGLHLFPVMNDTLWSRFFYEMPVLFLICAFIHCFIIGGFFAVLTLTATFLVNNYFLVQLFPLIFYTLYDLFAGMLNSTVILNMQRLQDITLPDIVNAQNFFLTLLIVASFSGIYFFCALKEDCL